jgi:hypothetical protein
MDNTTLWSDIVNGRLIAIRKRGGLNVIEVDRREVQINEGRQVLLSAGRLDIIERFKIPASAGPNDLTM